MKVQAEMIGLRLSILHSATPLRARGTANRATHRDRYRAHARASAWAARRLSLPASAAAHPLGEGVEITRPALGVAGNRHGHRVEQFAVMAGTAFDAQLIAMAREVAHRSAILAAHAWAMPWALAAGKGGAEQSGNKAVEQACALIHNQRAMPREALNSAIARLVISHSRNRHRIGGTPTRISGGNHCVHPPASSGLASPLATPDMTRNPPHDQHRRHQHRARLQRLPSDR